MAEPAVRTLHLLSAGAAQGLARSLEPGLEVALSARFGAVGAIKQAFDNGHACDVLVLTAAMIDALIDAGSLRATTRASLGFVRTGIAVREGDSSPDVATPEALRQALLAADEVYFPDPARATAGIHFAQVLRQLELIDALHGRLRPFPNGATAMRELAAATCERPIGCTQHTEILYTPGVRLVAPLPLRFELTTEYVAAVSTRAADPALARRFVHALAGSQARDQRAAQGFEGR